MSVAAGVIDVRGRCPGPVSSSTVRPAQINALLGTEFTSERDRRAAGPAGHQRRTAGTGGRRPAPVDRAHLPARHPSRPDGRGRHRRGGGPDLRVRADRPAHCRRGRNPGGSPTTNATDGGSRTCLCGLGGTRGLDAHLRLRSTTRSESGFDPPYIEVTNPLVESERFLRSSMAPGLLRAVVYNTERRQAERAPVRGGDRLLLPREPRRRARGRPRRPTARSG